MGNHEHTKPVVFGHHVTGQEPLVRDDRVFGLDTGACHGGNLIALCLPERTVHSVPARADHWATVRRQWRLPILRNRSWHDVTWQELDRAAERCSATPDPAVRQWLTALQEWAAGLRAAFPRLVDAAHRVVGNLAPEELRRHPAAPLLHQARAGRLDAAAVARQCPTPRRTIDLAAALGLTLDEPPR